MNQYWIKTLFVPLLAAALVSCPRDEITSIQASATPTTIAAAATSSLTAAVSGAGAFNTNVNWSIVSGGGSLSSNTGSSVTYTAPAATTATNVQIKASAAGNPNVSQTLDLTITAGKPAIIPDTTKVTDTATRAVLSAYDPTTGIMRFSQSTPTLAKLKPGDVLVSEPSSVAPNGYLRKVTSVRTEGTNVVVETTQANLTDAISQGTLAASGDLTAKNVRSTKVFYNGVTISAGDARVRPMAGVGQDFSFKLSFNQVFIPLTDPDGNAKGQISVDGSIEYSAGYGVFVGIEACFELPPVCVDSFETKIGFNQQASLRISGDLQGQLGKEIKVGEQFFDPIIFFIGPVPVVIIPHVDIFLAVSGQLTAKFDFRASQTAIAQLGARWTPNDGWKNISGFDFAGDAPAPTLVGTLKPKAGLRSSFSFLLYGLAGPEASLTGGIELDGQIPRNPTWIVNGFLKGTLGFVVELPIIGKLVNYQTTLFDKSLEFARAGNTTPKLELTANAKPDPNVFPAGTPRSVPLRQPVNFENGCGIFAGFYFNAIDLEDSCSVGVTVVSSVDGTLPKSFTFQTVGLRNITVTARDSQGASVSKSFTLNVINAPPTLELQTSGNPLEGEDYFITATIQDINEADLSKLCPNTVWSVDAPDTLSSTTGCAVKVKFGAQGARTVKVSTTDSDGATGSSQVTLTVQPPPVNPFPRIVNSGVYSRESRGGGTTLRVCSDFAVSGGGTIDLRQDGCTLSVLGTPPPRYSAAVSVENPTAEALTYDWKLLVKDFYGVESELLTANASSKPSFGMQYVLTVNGAPITGFLVTQDCKVTLRVNAPDVARSKGPITVWSGKCSYEVAVR